MSSGGIGKNTNQGQNRVRSTRSKDIEQVPQRRSISIGSGARPAAKNSLKTGYWTSFKTYFSSLFSRITGSESKPKFFNKNLRNQILKKVNEDLASAEKIGKWEADSRVSLQFYKDFTRDGRSFVLVNEDGKKITLKEAKHSMALDFNGDSEQDKEVEESRNKVNRFVNFCGRDKSLAISQSMTQWADALVAPEFAPDRNKRGKLNAVNPDHPFKLKNGAIFNPVGNPTIEQVITKKQDGSFEIEICTKYDKLENVMSPEPETGSYRTNPETSHASYTLKLKVDREGNWSVPKVSTTFNIDIVNP